jgi:hypothetical protein
LDKDQLYEHDSDIDVLAHPSKSINSSSRRKKNTQDLVVAEAGNSNSDTGNTNNNFKPPNSMSQPSSHNPLPKFKRDMSNGVGTKSTPQIE